MDTVKIGVKGARMVAHRGVSGLETENTMLAFVAAGNRSYYGVETDVRVTADGEYVLCHDETTERLSGISLIPEEHTLEELRSLVLFDKGEDVGNAAIRLCTVEEYLRVCKKYGKECVLELKTQMDEETTRRLIDRIASTGYLDRVIFISFLWEDLVHVRKILPNARIQYLFGELKGHTLDELRELRFDVDVRWQALSEETVKEYHAYGLEVNAWTVDDPEVAERLLSWGVDYITSNILE